MTYFENFRNLILRSFEIDVARFPEMLNNFEAGPGGLKVQHRIYIRIYQQTMVVFIEDEANMCPKCYLE